jgi:hypothetical protein
MTSRSWRSIVMTYHFSALAAKWLMDPELSLTKTFARGHCAVKACRSFFLPDGTLVPWFHGRITRQQAKELLNQVSHSRDAVSFV